MVIQASRRRIIATYLITMVAGYALFIAPNLIFGIFKIAGGLTGLNLALIGLFQLAAIVLLVAFALRTLGAGFSAIGWDFTVWRSDAAIGAALGLGWALVEMLWLIPAHGGAAEPNVARVIEGIGGSPAGLIGYLVLGVIGGGVAEEIFNRGFAINTLKAAFTNARLGLVVASVVSVALFMLGHIPQSGLDWLTILIPTLIYTALFVATGRLSAPIAAHAVHNAVVVVIIWVRYVG